MAMSKQDFIKIADAIRDWNAECDDDILQPQPVFTEDHLAVLADVFKEINPKFDRALWKNYVDGKCGPDGGPVGPNIFMSKQVK